VTYFEPIPPRTEAVAKNVIDAAFAVHSALGPGLLESVYEACMCHELSLRGVAFKSQLRRPIEYRGLKLKSGLRLDMVVEECVIVELKAVENHLPVFEAQLLTYLRLSQLRLGLLLNFNVPLIKDGIKRVVR
jgi:GxxExxY protein